MKIEKLTKENNTMNWGCGVEACFKTPKPEEEFEVYLAEIKNLSIRAGKKNITDPILYFDTYDGDDKCLKHVLTGSEAYRFLLDYNDINRIEGQLCWLIKSKNADDGAYYQPYYSNKNIKKIEQKHGL